ncbi:MAG: LysR family transcriptional regulator [Burkholderiaceae bacterium]
MNPTLEKNFTNQALRRLRLRHIELLQALGEVATVSAAAAKLNLSQPAVSKMLQEIEEVSQAQLFYRGRRGIEPSEMGRLLIRHASLTVHQFDAAGQQLQAMRLGASALLNVGCSSTMPLLPLAVAMLRKQMPSLLLRLWDEPPRQLIARLMAGEIDCALAPLPPDILSSLEVDGLRLQPVISDWMCVVASPHHRLAQRDKLRWSDVVSEQWVLSPPDGLTRQRFVAVCLDQGLTPPRPAIECVSFKSLRWLLRSDPTLLALTRAYQVMDDVQVGLVKVLPVSPVVELPGVSFITRQGTAADPEALSALLEALKEATKQVAAGVPERLV